MAETNDSFRPALIVVDFQEDFCPPNGSLAVPSGRSIAPVINALLNFPFVLKLATKDWHPPDHVSFASNHASAHPFTSSHTIHHPDDPSRAYDTTLWPVHCVQNSAGAQLVPELHAHRLDAVICKGQRPDVEMYSAFYDPFRLTDSGLSARLREAAITHVFVVGLAADYCVKATAEHALQEGYRTIIIAEGTRPVMPGQWDECRADIESKGISIVDMDDPHVNRVRTLTL